jgi:putative SOS response-associated peptidase YedK
VRPLGSKILGIDHRVLVAHTNPLPNIRERYNATPGQELAVVRKNPETGERSLDLLTWALSRMGRKIGKSAGARSMPTLTSETQSSTS